MSEPLDVIVVGSGPIGLEAAAGLAQAGQAVRVLEAEMLARSIFRWPHGTRFLSSPERVAIAGVPIHTPLQEPMTREAYLAYLRTVVEQHRLDVRCHAPVEAIDVGAERIVARTGGRHPGRHEASRIVIAVGRLARPARLEVPGADQAHVHHRLGDPHRYFGQRVAVVGDGNGALGAASRLWRCGAEVVIVHRSADLGEGQVRPELLADVRMLLEKGCVASRGEREVARIGAHDVELVPVGGDGARGERLPIDFVVPEIGYEPDHELLASCGVRLDDDGVPEHDPDTMETNVRRVHVVGTVVAAGNEATAISHAHDDVVKLVRSLTGTVPAVGDAPARRYKFRFGDDEPGC